MGYEFMLVAHFCFSAFLSRRVPVVYPNSINTCFGDARRGAERLAPGAGRAQKKAVGCEQRAMNVQDGAASLSSVDRGYFRSILKQFVVGHADRLYLGYDDGKQY